MTRCPSGDGYVLVRPAALAEADGDPFLGRVIGGRFAVIDVLGAGSMGTVYRARQEAMARDVALKIVRSDRLADPQAKSRFQQEARATSLLTSPHTVTVFDFGEVEGRSGDPEIVSGSLYLAMELLEGESLGRRLKRVGRLAAAEAVSIARQTLQSLAEAHDKGVIHRDLKPDNLVLVKVPSGDTLPPGAGAEMCKVLDFGIAKLLRGERGVDALETQAGTVFGTPRYMSPEQAQGKKLDPRSDLYSLGVILYHALAGQPPYTDHDAVVVMAHHIKTVPKRPSLVAPTAGIPRALEDLVMRTLDKDASKRPQTAAEFIALLDAVVLEPEVTAGTGDLAAVVGEHVRPSSTQRKLVLAGAAAALAVLVVAVLAGSRAGGVETAAAGVVRSAAGAAERVRGGIGVAPAMVAPAASSAASSAEPPEPPPGTSASPRKPAASAVPAKPKRGRGYTRFDLP
jgi:serine/threonine-protein kinase